MIEALVLASPIGGPGGIEALAEEAAAARTVRTNGGRDADEAVPA